MGKTYIRICFGSPSLTQVQIFLNFSSDSSSSDGIEFQNSDGEVVELPDDDETDDTTIDRSKSSNNTRSMRKSPRPEPQIMYIQMEFCEKSTLRFICRQPYRVHPHTL